VGPFACGATAAVEDSGLYIDPRYGFFLCDIEEDSGVWYMLYSATGRPSYGLATSTNLADWTPHPDNPIFGSADVTQWALRKDTLGCGDLVKEGDTWYLFYEVYPSNTTWYGTKAFGLAYTSDDAFPLGWKDYGPILWSKNEWPGSSRLYEDLDIVFSPDDGPSGTWYLYYTTLNSDGRHRIGYATTSGADFPYGPSGRKWLDHGQAYVPRPAWCSYGVGSPRLFAEGGWWYLYHYGLKTGGGPTNPDDVYIGVCTARTPSGPWEALNVPPAP
jgi:hypothetical protein